jgi:hypothetical protein
VSIRSVVPINSNLLKWLSSDYSELLVALKVSKTCQVLASVAKRLLQAETNTLFGVNSTPFISKLYKIRQTKKWETTSEFLDNIPKNKLINPGMELDVMDLSVLSLRSSKLLERTSMHRILSGCLFRTIDLTGTKSISFSDLSSCLKGQSSLTSLVLKNCRGLGGVLLIKKLLNNKRKIGLSKNYCWGCLIYATWVFGRWHTRKCLSRSPLLRYIKKITIFISKPNLDFLDFSYCSNIGSDIVAILENVKYLDLSFCALPSLVFILSKVELISRGKCGV